MFLLALLMSLNASQAMTRTNHPPCLIVVIGGGTNVTPERPDIADTVYRQALAAAQKTSCKVRGSVNQNSRQFLAFIRSLGQDDFAPKTAVHIAFAGHGAQSTGDVLNGHVVSGYGRANWTTNRQFAAALRDAFPPKTRVTYSTNSCFPRWHELMLRTRLDEHYLMCGTSSTSPDTYSWNFWNVSELNGLLRGSYTVMGLNRVNNDLDNDRTPTTLSMFHHHARINDANTMRSPGVTSSVFYAQERLSSRQIPSPLRRKILRGMLELYDGHPKASWATYATLDATTARDEIEGLVRTVLLQGRPFSFTPRSQRGPFGDTMVALAEDLLELAVVSPRQLGMPASDTARAARAYFADAAKLRTFASAIATLPREAALHVPETRKEDWVKRREQLFRPLFVPLFHLRGLQEALTVQRFIEVKTDDESVRYLNLQMCENLPFLTNGIPQDFSPEDWSTPGIPSESSEPPRRRRPGWLPF